MADIGIEETHKLAKRDEELADTVASILNINIHKAEEFVKSADRLYKSKMTKRFTELKFSDRLRRTNPFMVRVRNLQTVRQWAETQIASVLFASEEEAIGTS